MNPEITANIGENDTAKQEFNEPFNEYGRKPHTVFSNNLDFFGKGYHANY